MLKLDTDNRILPPTDQIETPQETLQCRQPEGQIQMIFGQFIRLILFQYGNMALFLETIITFLRPRPSLDFGGLHRLIRKSDTVAGVCFPNALHILSGMSEPIFQ